MIPAPVTDEMVQQFGHPLEAAVKRTFVGPPELKNVAACEGVVERSADGFTAVVRVPMRLEPQELTKLLNGGTVWVSMWGGLSPFAVEVVAGPDDVGQVPHAQKALHRMETQATALAAADAGPIARSV